MTDASPPAVLEGELLGPDDKRGNGAKTAKGQRRPKDADIDKVLEAISEGRALRAICRELGIHVPTTNAMLKRTTDELRERYAHAREDRVEALGEEVLTIARAAALKKQIDGQDVDVAGARVLIDAVKWLGGRMDPRNNATHRVHVQYEDITPDERRARIADYQARIGLIAVKHDADDTEPDASDG